MCAEPADKTLCDKVKDWFESEGYPLEFRVARAFEEEGFNPKQGHYVLDSDNHAREMDIVADMDIDYGDKGFFRVSHVIECKWSRDKPWVVFTSGRSRMAESACIAQTAGSLLGEAVMYCLADESELYPLEMFKHPVRGGFSGRRAFEKQDKENYDLFYRTIQGLVNVSIAESRRYGSDKPRTAIPRSGLIVFPVVVVDGNLFEAYYDVSARDVKVTEVDELRLFWRGSKAKQTSINRVDIVTAKKINDFARTRASETKKLLEVSRHAINKIQNAFVEHRFDLLEIKSSPRGFIGLPALLFELYELHKIAGKAPQLAE